MTARKARRSLTPEAFGKFLRRLSDDDEQAVRQYQAIRQRLVRYFTFKGSPDPDGLFDETVDIVAGKIDAREEILNPLAYCHGVAKNVWRQSMRARQTVSITRDFVSPEPEDSIAHERELSCLTHCLSRLPADEREILTRYYASDGRERIDTRKALAGGQTGVNALRVKLCRIRKDLRLCLAECLRRSA